MFSWENKANLTDMIAATRLVILLKLDSNLWLFSLCDLAISWMTSENNRAPLLYYIKLYVSFQIHRWNQTGVTVRKMLNSGQNQCFFVLCDLEIWWMTLKNSRAPLLCCFKLSASFHSHKWIQTGDTVLKHPVRVNFMIFCPLWPWNLTDDPEKQ